MISISVIMPLYNAAKYLEECLNSILNQTLTDFELICVNDASTDSTLDILENFRKRDNRVTILSNATRSGAAYSRNRGMKEATGQYLAFLDGDDIYDEDMYNTAYHVAVENNADIIMYEYRHVASDRIYNKLEVFHSPKYIERYCREPFSIPDYEPYEWLNWGSPPWNKLYRREFIRDNQIFFQNLPSSNDVYFVCMALLLSKKILHVDDCRVMVYARDHDEATRISADREPRCVYQAFLHLAEELKARGLFPNLYPYFYYRFFYAMRSALRQCKIEEKEKDFYGFLQEEGIDQICSMAGEYYDNLDAFVRNSIEQFKTQSFDSGWYKEETGLALQLSSKNNAGTVINLFDQFKNSHKKVGIWGVGANGISLLKFCRQNNLQVDMVIDMSKEKRGCIVEGYRIDGPEDINDHLQVIIVSARHICESVMKKVAKWNIEVIDLNQLLYVY